MENGKRKKYVKLTAKEQDYVVQRLASGFSLSMIKEDLKSKFDVDIARESLHLYTKGEWGKKVMTIRKTMDEKLADHPLASKLARLDWLLGAAEEANEFRTDKVMFDKKGKKIILRKRSFGEIKGIMREARIEMEGDKEPPIVGVKIVIERPDGSKG